MILKDNITEIKDRLSEYKDRISGKTFLVIGGAGFLGKNIVWTLMKFNEELDEKCKIIVLDNYVTGDEVFQLDENIECIKYNIMDKFKTDKKIDYIMNLAGIASPKFYSKYKLEVLDTTIQGTRNVLDMSNECESVLFFSTSEVYGNPTDENIPTPETYNGNVSCLGPRAHYDESKRLAETLCAIYADIFGTKVKIVRPFNVYGPGMRLDDGRGLVNLVICAVLGENLPIYGDGLSTRTWTYITDGVVGFMKILFSDANGEVFNVGIDKPEISTLDLAKLIKKKTESESKIVITKAPVKAYKKVNDVHRRCPDISKIKKRLNFKPEVDLESGLKRTIDWIRDVIMKQGL